MSHRPSGAYRANVGLLRPSGARPAAPGRAAVPLTAAGFGSRGGHSGRSDRGGRRLSEQGQLSIFFMGHGLCSADLCRKDIPAAGRSLAALWIPEQAVLP